MNKLFFFIAFFIVALNSHQLLAQPSVSSAQQALTRFGYYQGTIDGSMGSATSAAIRRFQVANHLRPTGTLTPETIEALGLNNRSSTKKNFPQLRTATPSSLSPDPKALADIFIGGPLLAASPEIQVATVQKAQRNLKLLGYYAGPINGFPDANLKAALQAYQKDSKFKRSGRLDKITLMGLNILPGSYQSGS